MGRECPDIDCVVIFEPSEWNTFDPGSKKYFDSLTYSAQRVRIGGQALTR
jgi:hypothetical protein